MVTQLLLALSALAAPADAPVAWVGERAISSSQLAARLVASRPAGASAVLEALVDEAVLADEGRRRGLERGPEIASRVELERARLAVERLQRDVQAAARVDDQVLLELYHSSADTARLQQLTFASREEAAAAADRLAKGGDLASEAKRAIKADAQPATVSRMQLDRELAKAVFAASPGSVVGPVQLALGWGVAKVLERTVADERGLEPQRERLREFAQKQAAVQLRQHLVATLRKKASPTVDEAFIRSTGSRLAATAAELERPVATVGKQPVRYADVLAEVKRISAGGAGGHAGGPGVKLQLAWHLVDERLLQDDALARGFGRAPDVEAALQNLRHALVAGATSEQVRASVPPPSKAEIEQYYQAHRQELAIPGTRECAHIVAPSAPAAEAIRKAIAAGERFEVAAARASTDASTAAQGGSLGVLTDPMIDGLASQGGEPGLAGTFRASPAGTIAGPVPSKMGWHLVRCGVYAPGKIRPLADASASIAERLRADRAEAAVRSLVRELRARAGVRVDAAAVERAARPLAG